MYKAYMSFAQLKEYLTFLQNRDLIRYEQGTQLYTITAKGLKFMNAFEEIKELVPVAKVRNDTLKQNALS
jgi:predicted transcriptional regulator